MEPTRLERIAFALLQSDYVKMAFLQAEELCGMARLIELQLDVVANMTEEQARAHRDGALRRPR